MRRKKNFCEHVTKGTENPFSKKVINDDCREEFYELSQATIARKI